MVSRSSAAPPAQATLLAAISGMPHHHPGLLTTPVRVVTIGVVGGFVAATVVAFQMSPSLAGAFVAPIVGGALIEATSYETAFLVGGALAAVGVAFVWVVPES